MLPDMELAVSRLGSALAESMNLHPDKIDEIKMALIEACLNAFEHSKSKDQMVHVKFRIKPEELEIIVRDYGIGFDTSVIPRPSAKEKIKPGKVKRGWGFTIMQSLMDDLRVRSDKSGTQIIMIKRRL